MNSSNKSPSGFSILLHSPITCILIRLLSRLNALVRPLLPLLHLFMFGAIGTILAAVIFVNQHLPCWYDEIYMLDPAYQRATTGVWQSVGRWESIGAVPYAPNYPLLCNLLRLLVFCFGAKFQVLRASMLVFGFIPVIALFCLFLKKGLLHSWKEVLYAAYFVACFSFFHWAIYIRPEAVLLSVATLLVFAWVEDHPLLLFLSALLIPTCGLQWNVLLLPAVLYWLFFGGHLRNPLLVVFAFLLSTCATIGTYHALGMWPSYIQEAACVGGLNPFHSAVTKLHGVYANFDFSWLLTPIALPPIALFCFLMSFVPIMLSDFGRYRILHPSKMGMFVCSSIAAVILALGLFGRMSSMYARLLVFPMALCTIPLGRTFFRWPLSCFVFVLLAIYPAKVNWAKSSHPYAFSPNVANDSRWYDASSLQCALSENLSGETLVLGDDSSYFAVRSLHLDFLPACYAFDLPKDLVETIGAILLSDVPDACYAWCASPRKSVLEFALSKYKAKNTFIGDEAVAGVTPEVFLAAVAEHWKCTFAEIPLALDSRPGFIHYRLFRPIF